MRRFKAKLVTRRLSPKYDIVFRKLFGSTENKALLISLINSIVAPQFYIVDLVILDPYNFAKYVRSKSSILDIKARSDDGVWYDIELQILNQSSYGKRALYYLAKVYVDQLTEAESFSALTTTIGIHLVDFEFVKDDRVVHRYLFKEAETNEECKQLSYLQLYFVEMNKARKAWSEVRTLLDRWLAFLNEAEQLNLNDLPDALREEPLVVRAAAELERMGLNSDERHQFELEVESKMLEAADLVDAGVQANKEMLARLISGWFADVPSDLPRKLDRLSIDKVNELGHALRGFTTYADVDAWISSQVPQRRAN